RLVTTIKESTKIGLQIKKERHQPVIFGLRVGLSVSWESRFRNTLDDSKLTRQEKARINAGSGWRDTGYVFTNTIGTPIDDRKILKEFNALMSATKLPKQRFHDLRHA